MWLTRGVKPFTFKNEYDKIYTKKKEEKKE